MPSKLVLALVAATGCVPAAQRLTPSIVPVTGHADVHVEADDADVHVTTADVGEVTMNVTSRGYDADDLDISMVPHGNRIDITAKTKWKFRLFSITARSLRIDIVVPRDADVAVRSGDGSVDTEHIVGRLDVHTGDGSISVRDTRGAMRLETGDGSITGVDLDGAVRAHSGDGSVKLAGRFDALNVNTSDGSLTMQVRPGSRMVEPWRLKTGDGSVTLDLPRDLRAHLDARTGDGSVSSNIPLTRRGDLQLADLNGGGPALEVRTGDGSISIDAI